MSTNSSAVAVFQSHPKAEEAVRELQKSDFDTTKLSIIGKDYHTDEHVVGYYNAGDRMLYWRKSRATEGANACSHQQDFETIDGRPERLVTPLIDRNGWNPETAQSRVERFHNVFRLRSAGCSGSSALENTISPIRTTTISLPHDHAIFDHYHAIDMTNGFLSHLFQVERWHNPVEIEQARLEFAGQ